MTLLSTESQTPWGWAQAAALVGPAITLLGTAVTVAVTYALNQQAARRERRARSFAEALTAIEDYAEMPYRIRRRLGTPDARHEISAELSKIQSRIAFQHAWLQIEATEVAAVYHELICAARNDAGKQIRDAWARAAAATDKQMIEEDGPYPRDRIDVARSQCIVAMRAALGRRRRNRGFDTPILPFPH